MNSVGTVCPPRLSTAAGRELFHCECRGSIGGMTDIDSRSLTRTAFLAQAGLTAAGLEPLPVDASFRRYFRLTGAARPMLLMDAPPPKEDVRLFIRIARHLTGLRLSAPTIYEFDNEQGFALIEDFGEATYTRLLDAGAVILVLAVLVLFAVGRRLTISPPVVGVIALLLIAYPVVPFFLMQTAWVDQRMPILAGFLLFAGTFPRVRSGRTARLMLVAFAVAILARTYVIALDWSGHDAQIADFRQVIEPVQPGDRVLVVQVQRNADPDAMVNRPDSVRAMVENDATMHLPALLVIDRKAFWPLLFTAPTKQPVKVNPPYDMISLPEGELPWAGGLADLDPATLKWAPYLPDWQHKFDWVLVLNPGDAPDGYSLPFDQLERVSAGRIAVLYRIRK